MSRPGYLSRIIYLHLYHILAASVLLHRLYSHLDLFYHCTFYTSPHCRSAHTQ